MPTDTLPSSPSGGTPPGFRKSAFSVADGNLTNAELLDIVDEFFSDAADMLRSKNRQYAQGPDPLANFRETAAFLRTGMLETLAPHLHKHYRSLMSGLLTAPIGETREHCLDIANYLAFILAIKTEMARRQEST